MQTGALIQHGGFEELQNLTALPRIKIFQKGSKIRPSLPSIRQLLCDINARSSENNFSSNGNCKAPVQAHVFSSLSPAEMETSTRYARLSQNEGLRFAPTLSGASRPNAATYQVSKNSSVDKTQHVPLRANTLAPHPTVFPGRASRPTEELLKLAYLVETPSLGGNGADDALIQLNKDYQLKIAETLESLQILYHHMQEWPLSLHSKDMKDHDAFALLIDYVSPDSLKLTIRMARRAFESLRSIEQWKLKYKKLHPNLPRCQSGKVIKKNNPSRMNDAVKTKKRQFEFQKSKQVDSGNTSVTAVNDYNGALRSNFQCVPVTLPNPESSLSSAGLQCAHCSTTKTPEWRKGPYGKRSLCNACGLFYKKLVRKFGDSQAGRIMKYRKMSSNSDRKVPRVFDVPDSE
ncbi:GATA-type transcription factor LALA0_S07e00188g [Lachancea lanzarotensis]|uniref:LALA0S07e00188g1_1 n=1 Tax=Lachancea lanzarotensis TaxID=1245769 RepID=A0A0C7MZ42_9SACH|nr:uncharacterized protein LALA0_S07e00188g [Lachancea lanzarotensis]CEP63002.1 LALA0S07e00188g1_1 [Lachancea lanzarotensis]